MGTLPAPTTLLMPAPVLAGVENFASPLPLIRQAGAKSSTAGRIGLSEAVSAPDDATSKHGRLATLRFAMRQEASEQAAAQARICAH